MRIAICDDEEIYRHELRQCIREYCDDSENDYELDMFSNGEELLAKEKRYDIIFLDIEMGELDGLEVAEHIRAYDMNVPIIYVTSYSQYALKAYKVHPFAFVEKPVKMVDIEQIMDDYLKMQKERKQKNLQVQMENGIVNINMYELMYVIVCERRNLLIKTLTRTYKVKHSIAYIWEKLDKEMFYQCHRSCIVNLKYVQRLENNFDIILTNGEFCPLAQKKKSEFLQLIASHYLESLKGSEL